MFYVLRKYLFIKQFTFLTKILEYLLELLYFAVNCWPNETSSGCDVNIEYDLEKEDMELNDVVISIPVP